MSGKGSIPKFLAVGIGFDLGGELKEQAELADLDRLLHDVHAEEIIENDALQDEVAAVGVCRDIRQYQSKIRVLFWAMRLARPIKFINEPFHAGETCFVQRLQNIQRREEKGAGTTGRIKDGDTLDSMPERSEQFWIFAILRWRPERIGGYRD